MHRSFAEVVMSGSASLPQGKKSDGEQKELEFDLPCFKVDVEPSLWLESCFIGRFSELSNFQAVKESVVVGGYGSLSLSYLGENFMLLAGNGEISVAKVIDDNKEWFGDIFDSLVPWDNSFSVSGKVAWVQIRVLPLMFWNRQCFELIGELVGKFIEVDEATEAREILEFARLRIKIPAGGNANVVKNIIINDYRCRITFEEDTCHRFSQLGCSKCMEWGQLFEGSSEARYLVTDDEDVVESVFSDIGGEDDGAKGNLVLLEDPELVDFSSKVGVDLKEGAMPALGSQNNEWERLGSQNRAWERMEMGGAFKGVQNHVSGGVNEGSSRKEGGWSDEFFCVGPTLAQVHVVGGAKQPLVSDPSADVADHVGFPATCNFGVGGEVYPSGVALGGTPASDDAVAPIMSNTLPTERWSNKAEMKVDDDTVLVTSTITVTTPLGHLLGASACDEVAAAPVYRDEGLEVTGGRGLGYNEHLGGSPAVEGLSEAADGGEVDGANRSVGKESVGAVEMVFSAKAAGGKRLSKTFSKTSLKNMRRKVAPSSMAGKRLETVVSSISDNDVRNCNNRYWLENKESEAQKNWNMGKVLGFLFAGKEEVVVKNLQALEARDRDNMLLKRKESVVSDDENN
ncbi:hypothetical protein PHAVU_007G156800 [Phaseolus vulgaris]